MTFQNDLIKKFGLNLSKNVKLSNYSWFNLGGNADYFFKAKDKDHLKSFLTEANKTPSWLALQLAGICLY